MGGPLRRDRVFYFVNWERNDQQAVASTTVLAPDFAHLSRVTASPLLGDLFSVRLDGRISRCAFRRSSATLMTPARRLDRQRDHRWIAERVPIELEPRRDRRCAGCGGPDERAAARR